MNNLLLASAGTIILYVGIGLLAILIVLIFALVPIKTWFIALVSGSHVSMTRLIGMKMRRIPVATIIDAYIMARKAGIDVDVVSLETHHLAGGDVRKVINALIAAHSAKIDLDIEEAKAIDLAGRDVDQAVRQSVTPKVITTDFISAVAKDGIELKVKVRITVKANIARFVGGAGDETILARVGEGIVTTVGSAETHGEVLENPDFISQQVIDKGLDLGTSYKILSIDIADIDVGANIGAELKKKEAEARKIVAQAEAEERRAMAEAHEQEMKAKTQQMQAVLIAAEAEVPKAMAEAIKEGKLGVMDYYKIQNLNADTSMRKAIAGESNNNKKDDNNDF
ncbi:MAG: flotillin-like protein FloA [Eubacteriales bacterium]|nr:flotillin-like protein FloA [Clostridia bacterium]MDY2696300.1 flotillin-like protein FloA [Eubacteriales bacterium]